MKPAQRISFRARGLIALLVTAPALFAADDSKVLFPGGGTQTAAPDHSGSTVNVITLLLALVLAVAGGWIMWRRRRAGGALREAHALAIHETRSLGNRQYLVVAAYEGRKFLLGVCPGRIDLLAPLSDRRSPESPAS